MSITSKEIHLAAHPQGLPTEADFCLVETTVDDIIRDGELLVENLWMSVDPYMRGRMRGRATHLGGFVPGEVLEGGAIGRVLASRHANYAKGDYVASMKGWREYFVVTGSELTKITAPIAPLSSYLGVLGMPGLTAYVGLTEIAKLRAGERVFVSAASGAVGAVACQIAKNMGCYVVGSAGSNEKCNWLTEVAGIDAAINYKTCDDLTNAVAKAFPNGIDVYFENVGGAHQVAALNAMNLHGRIALCGMISHYNYTNPQVDTSNLMVAVWKQLTIQGFIVRSYGHLEPAYHAAMERWIANGSMLWKETVEEGIENAPKAFIGLFSGDNFGKMLVQFK